MNLITIGSLSTRHDDTLLNQKHKSENVEPRLCQLLCCFITPTCINTRSNTAPSVYGTLICGSKVSKISVHKQALGKAFTMVSSLSRLLNCLLRFKSSETILSWHRMNSIGDLVSKIVCLSAARLRPSPDVERIPETPPSFGTTDRGTSTSHKTCCSYTKAAIHVLPAHRSSIIHTLQLISSHFAAYPKSQVEQ